MFTGMWESAMWELWDHHYYVVCSCGFRYDDKDKWDIYPLWARHILEGSQ